MSGAAGEYGASRNFRALLMFGGLVGLVTALCAWILNGSSLYLELGAMAVGMVVITFAILKDWRVGFFFFVLWLLLEDLARKYLGNGTLFFFGKDVLAAIMYLSLVIAKRRGDVKFFRATFFVPLGMFFGLALIQVFNTASPSILYGLLGLKLYFYYIPLMFVSYAMIQSVKDLDRFLVFNVVVGFIIAFLGIVQSIVGLSFLNPPTLAPELQELGNLTRYSPLTHQAVPVPTSVFVSGGRFTIYMVLVITLALGSQAYLFLAGRKGAIWGFLGIGIALIGAMQGGSRAVIVNAFIAIIVISGASIWGGRLQGFQRTRLKKAAVRAFFVAVAGLLIMIQLFPKSIGASWAFYWETLDPNSSRSELHERTIDYPLTNLEKALGADRWLIGYGTGTSSVGTQYIVRLTGVQAQTITVENGFGELILEMGILGAILWLVWSIMFLSLAWKIVQGLRGTVYFPLAFAIFWYCFLLLIPLTYINIDAYENFVMNAYFWLLAGVLIRLPELARMPQAVAPARSQARAPVGVPAFARARL